MSRGCIMLFVLMLYLAVLIIYTNIIKLRAPELADKENCYYAIFFMFYDNYLQVLHEQFAQVMESLQLLSDRVFESLEISPSLLTTLHALAAFKKLPINISRKNILIYKKKTK